ncbi:hypothetical protein JCM18899A_50690 [Nocardioides sp. AN3]
MWVSVLSPKSPVRRSWERRHLNPEAARVTSAEAGDGVEDECRSRSLVPHEGEEAGHERADSRTDVEDGRRRPSTPDGEGLVPRCASFLRGVAS